MRSPASPFSINIFQKTKKKMSSDSSHSLSHSSSQSSYLPEGDDQVQVPPSGILLQYPDVDPTNFLDNPEIDYDYAYKDTPLSEKEGAALVTLLQQYKRLAVATFDFNLNHIKFKLNNDSLTQQDAFDALDRFYRDMRDVMPLTSGFLNEQTLALFKEKQQMHEECARFIEEYKNVTERCKSGGVPGGPCSIDFGCNSECSNESEVKESKKTKKKGKKKGKGKQEKPEENQEEPEPLNDVTPTEEKKASLPTSPQSKKNNKKRRGKRGGKGHSPKKETPHHDQTNDQPTKPNFVESIVGIAGVSSSLSPPSS